METASSKPRYKEGEKMFVKLWMQRDVTTVAGDTSLAEADALFKELNFRHLPVVEGDELIGIITLTDIKKALPSARDSSMTPQDRILAAQTNVSSFMATSPVTANPMDPLEDVALLMRKHKIGAIPVVENNKITGIITESDIFEAFIEISGRGEAGARMEVLVGHDKSAIYSVMDTCRRFDMHIRSITIYRNFSPEQQLITLRLTGKNLEETVDGLWKTGAKVNRVLMQEG